MSIKLKSTKHLSDVVPADLYAMVWEKSRRGSGDHEEDDEEYGHDSDVPKNGITDTVRVGSDA